MQEKLNITDEMLLDYIDGSLSEAERNQVESQLHLPDLKSRLKDFQQIDMLLGTHFTDEIPSPEFSNKVMESVMRTQVQTSPRKTTLPLLVFAVAVMVILAGVTLDTSGIPDIGIPFPALNLEIDFANLFYGILLVLLLGALWLLDKVWIQGFFKSETGFE